MNKLTTINYKTIKTDILGVYVDKTSSRDVIDRISLWIENGKYFGFYICVCNVHMIMESFDNIFFSKVLDKSKIVLPDGMPLVWAQKLLGQKSASRVAGMDLTLGLCNLAEKKGYNIGFYGGHEGSLDKLEGKLKNLYPKIKIKYLFSPPFRPLNDQENLEVEKEINSKNLQILFVGIGCPKQEYWMNEKSQKIKPIMVGVGAVFDILAGNKKMAPKWMSNIGLEWLYRFIIEPKRLFYRYARHNPRFIYYFVKQLFFRTKLK